MISESLRLNQVVLSQAGLWNIVRQPLGFVIFVGAVMAETNRLPFDLPEAEPELVAGYHTEYSSMKFSMFFIAEYSNLLVGAALIVTLFLGGWLVPGLNTSSMDPFLAGVIGLVAFLVKLFIVIFVFIWIRWTLPRFRYDQLMNLGWKVFLPLALFNIFITGLVMVLIA
jgi:NADH-quinone oxidoreductase subunit H